MKKKIFLSLIAALPTLTFVSIPLSSCGKKEEKKEDPTETKYTVKFACTEGVTLSSTADIQVVSGTKWKDIKNLPQPTHKKDDFINCDWWDVKNRKKIEQDTEITSDLTATYVAYEKSKTLINLTFNVDGTKSQPFPFVRGWTFGDFKNSYPEFVNPTKDNCKFNYWLAGNIEVNDDYVFPDQDSLELVAYFTTIQRKISFLITEGVVCPDGQPKDIYVDNRTTWDKVTLPRTIVQNGYVGYGWYDNEKNTKLEPGEKIEKDVVAKFIAFKDSDVAIKVTVVVDIGEEYQVDFVKGRTFADFKEMYPKMKEKPQKQYYFFDGWYDQNHITQFNDGYYFMDNTIIKAVYTRKEHTISFSATDGVTFTEGKPFDFTYKDGSKWGDVWLPDMTIDKNYTPFGWYDADTLTMLKPDTILADRNISAMYVALETTSAIFVSIKIAGKTYGPIPFIKGGSFSTFKEMYPAIKQTPTKTGHTFLNWSIEGNTIDESSYNFPLNREYVTIEAVFDTKDFRTCDWDIVINHCNQLENGEMDEKEFCKSFTNDSKPINSLNDLVGLERTIKINDKDHAVRVIGIQHDEIHGNDDIRAILTFQLSTVLSSNSGDAINTTWDTEDNRNYLNSILRDNLNATADDSKKTWTTSAYMLLPEGLRNGLKKVNKNVAIGTAHSIVQYSDYIFPLSATEYDFKEQGPWVEGKAYKYWTEHNSDKQRIMKDINNNVTPYWLVSSYTAQYNRTYRVEKSGLINVEDVDNNNGVAFAFCI